ncbi:MAG: iron-containing redox enzyme family protein [Steroidobacter sp.]
MDGLFVRTGPLMDVNSYPAWLRDIVHECAAARHEVVNHALVRCMRDGTLPAPAMWRFLTGLWPVIEQFPQDMAMNLLKVRYDDGPGQSMARTYLIRNIRVEQNHVEYWIDWARAHGVGREELFLATRSGAMDALSHWCWRTCHVDPLAVAMAATNYAIEGATGEWTTMVCASTEYSNQFAPDERGKAMKWLRMHAQYDDTHPWEALEIIATLIGPSASSREIAAISAAIRKSYEYMVMAFNDCLMIASADEMPAIGSASGPTRVSSRTAPGT